MTRFDINPLAATFAQNLTFCAFLFESVRNVVFIIILKRQKLNTLDQIDQLMVVDNSFLAVKSTLIKFT